MSMDMRVIKVKDEYARGPVDCCLYIDDQEGERHYIRHKVVFDWYHTQLFVHSIMRRLYIKKGGGAYFHMQPVELNLKDLQYLESLAKKRVGYDKNKDIKRFFIESDILKMVRKARIAIYEGYHVYYYAG